MATLKFLNVEQTKLELAVISASLHSTKMRVRQLLQQIEEMKVNERELGKESIR